MRKNKRKWICILMLALLFCISAAAVTETRTGSADKGNNRLCEKEGQNVLL